MRKLLTAAMAAITLGGAVCATAAPAEARPHGGYYGGSYGGGHYYRGNNNGGAALAAGVVGLALGAAIASNGHSYNYNRGYYDRGYYPDGYYAYDGGYRTCESTRWVWDPYIGRRVPVTSRYAC
ncbi:hypothetical protein [Phenylobacterium sp.]|uniref:hypothetical protein n=1 Tax=Phenylobacterium sp. TaxID=1871053 RepID=UPI0035671834